MLRRPLPPQRRRLSTNPDQATNPRHPPSPPEKPPPPPHPLGAHHSQRPLAATQIMLRRGEAAKQQSNQPSCVPAETLGLSPTAPKGPPSPWPMQSWPCRPERNMACIHPSIPTSIPTDLPTNIHSSKPTLSPAPISAPSAIAPIDAPQPPSTHPRTPHHGI